MTDEVAGPQPEMTPEDAVQRMAAVTHHARGLRVRTEGLTFFIFGICMLASYLTIVVPILFGAPGGGERFERGFQAANATFNATGPGGRGPPPTQFFLSAYAPLVWYLIAALGTIGIWRGASLSFRIGPSTPRLVGVLIGWLAIFAIVTVTLTYFEGGNPRSWHLIAWAVVLALFAAFNPLAFSRGGRVVGAIMAAVTIATAAYVLLADLPGRDIGFVTGAALGIPGIAGGLWLLYRG